MKTKSYLIGLLCIGALAGLLVINKAPAQGNGQRQPAATLLISYQYTGSNINGRYIPFGAQVSSVSRSSLAPDVPLGASVAELIAQMQDEGYEVIPSQRGLEILFNRAPR